MKIQLTQSQIEMIVEDLGLYYNDTLMESANAVSDTKLLETYVMEFKIAAFGDRNLIEQNVKSYMTNAERAIRISIQNASKNFNHNSHNFMKLMKEFEKHPKKSWWQSFKLSKPTWENMKSFFMTSVEKGGRAMRPIRKSMYNKAVDTAMTAAKKGGRAIKSIGYKSWVKVKDTSLLLTSKIYTAITNTRFMHLYKYEHERKAFFNSIRKNNYKEALTHLKGIVKYGYLVLSDLIKKSLDKFAINHPNLGSIGHSVFSMIDRVFKSGHYVAGSLVVIGAMAAGVGFLYYIAKFAISAFKALLNYTMNLFRQLMNGNINAAKTAQSRIKNYNKIVTKLKSKIKDEKVKNKKK